MDTIICFGVNETRCLGDGWHEREVWHDPRRIPDPSQTGPGNGRVYRYTSGCAWIKLDPSWAGTRIAFLLAATATQLAGVMTIRLTASSRETPEAKPPETELAAMELRDDGWRLIEAPLPEMILPGAMLQLAVAPVFVPGKILRNGDYRALGVRVAAFRIES